MTDNSKTQDPREELDEILKAMQLEMGRFLLESLKEGAHVRECLDFLKANRRVLPEGTFGSKVDETNNYIASLVEETPGLTRR